MESELKACLKKSLNKQQTITHLKNKEIQMKDEKTFEKELDRYCMKFWCKKSFEIAREHFQNK